MSGIDLGSLIPANEPGRLAAVRRYEILDTPPDGTFDRITAIAARLLDVPISIVSIVDHDRIWFKSHHGLSVTEIGRDPGLCASAILRDDPSIIPDAKRDLHALANPLVAGEFGLRFYAGAPLRTPDGFNLGTLCVIDKEPRTISAEQIDLLKDLAAVVMDQLELRRAARSAFASEEAVIKELAIREDLFRTIADSIPQLAWIADGEGNLEWFNRRWLEYTGTTLEENLGVGWKAVHHPDYVDAVAEKFERHLREGREWEDTFPLRGKDGNYRWFLSRMNVIRDGSGKVVRFFGTNTDITNERMNEDRKQFLIRELEHRSQNLLAVIQAITLQTLTGAQLAADEREILVQRIQALGRSQSALVTGGFEGADVAEILEAELKGFSNRVKAVGPNIMLSPRAAQTFSLALHELATNAVKYGALSGSKGRVAIRWSSEGEDEGDEARFKFHWQELDGPPVALPTRHGFGSVLLNQAVAQDFRVTPKTSFAPGGLIYEIDAPLSVIAADSTRGSAST